jgi:hypothetical protein
VPLADHSCASLSPQRDASGTASLVLERVFPTMKPLLSPASDLRDWPRQPVSKSLEILQGTRLPRVVLNVFRLLTTFALIIAPSSFWIPAFLIAAIPLRISSTLTAVMGDSAWEQLPDVIASILGQYQGATAPNVSAQSVEPRAAIV